MGRLQKIHPLPTNIAFRGQRNPNVSVLKEMFAGFVSCLKSKNEQLVVFLLVLGMDMFNFACLHSCSFLSGEMSGSPAVDEVKPSPSSRIQVFAVEHLSLDERGSSP